MIDSHAKKNTSSIEMLRRSSKFIILRKQIPLQSIDPRSVPQFSILSKSKPSLELLKLIIKLHLNKSRQYCPQYEGKYYLVGADMELK